MSGQKISDIVPDDMKQRAKQLAEEHVDWFLGIVKPLLTTEFLHGYRHGYEDRELKFKEENEEFKDKLP